jgi:hypothetical protein
MWTCIPQSVTFSEALEWLVFALRGSNRGFVPPVAESEDALIGRHHIDRQVFITPSRVDVVGDKKGTAVGAGRVLNQAFHETLRELSEEDRTFSYSIDDGPSPVSKAHVSSYVGRVSVNPITEGGGTLVQWSSSWQKNDQPTAEFCHGIYVALSPT